MTSYPSAPPPYTTQPHPIPPNVTVHVVRTFGENSENMMCPNCNQMIWTNVEYEMGCLFWLLFCIMFCLICWPCAFIFCCMDSTKDVIHVCPQCKAIVGEYRRL